MSLPRIFWYVAVIGGQLILLPAMNMVAMNASTLGQILIIVLTVGFWLLVFIRVIQAGQHYGGATFWKVCAISIVGLQLAFYLIGLVLLGLVLL